MDTLAKVCAADPGVLLATPYRVVDVTDAESQEAAVTWWTDLTSRGGEGMVVKPFGFVARGQRGLIQPALKIRGREYLRIIYGPEYDLPENLERLRARGLSSRRSLALREFALGVESLERFVRGEPLAGFTSASSGCWPSRASRSTRGCEPPTGPHRWLVDVLVALRESSPTGPGSSPRGGPARNR
jgi:hypothetical protein